jgi:hypothetical protein
MPRNCRQCCNGQGSRRTGTATRVGMEDASSNPEHVRGAARTSSEDEGIDQQNGGIAVHNLNLFSPARATRLSVYGCTRIPLQPRPKVSCPDLLPTFWRLAARISCWGRNAQFSKRQRGVPPQAHQRGFISGPHKWNYRAIVQSY